jgi:hypothetical protein
LTTSPFKAQACCRRCVSGVFVLSPRCCSVVRVGGPFSRCWVSSLSPVCGLSRSASSHIPRGVARQPRYGRHSVYEPEPSRLADGTVCLAASCCLRPLRSVQLCDTFVSTLRSLSQLSLETRLGTFDLGEDSHHVEVETLAPDSYIAVSLSHLSMLLVQRLQHVAMTKSTVRRLLPAASCCLLHTRANKRHSQSRSTCIMATACLRVTSLPHNHLCC